jgi:signal transduction histidine kinase
MQSTQESRLTTRILFWVVAICVLMFSAVTVLTVLLEREGLYRKARRDAQSNVTRNIAAISTGLWNFDIITLKATLQGLTQTGSIVRAEVLNRQQQVVATEREHREEPEHVWEVPIFDPERSEQIGTLRVSESYEDVRDLLTRNLATELVAELVKIGGLAALLFVIIYRLITRHLRALARDVSDLKPGSSTGPIKLQRKKVHNDELDTLVSSINRFRNERAEAEEALQRDIAERKLVEAALHASETQRYLIETERLAALGGLVAGVAHEISGPIGTSLTVASTLARRSADFVDEISSGHLRRTLLAEFADGCRDAADQLVVNLQRAGGLIQSFKQVAVDRSSADRRAFDLKLATEQVIASVRPRLLKSQSSLATEIPPDIIMDSFPGLYGQVLTNLVFNAVAHAFGDVAGGHMLIKARRIDSEQVEITFSDDGRGMPEAVQRRIFDPFFTTRRAQGSTGLGLHIVHNIVTQRLGGRITLVSAPGKGTIFCVTLPLLAPGEELEPTSTSERLNSHLESDDPGRHTS